MLAGHMQKYHYPIEMPYKCGACQYRSSSHHKTIDHFYAKHSNLGVLQCPYCLKTHTVFVNGVVIIANVRHYLKHLLIHQNKGQCKKCNRCSLWFTHKGLLKAHQINSHYSHVGKEKAVKVLCTNVKTSIIKPKPKAANIQNVLNLYKVVKTYSDLTIVMEPGKICLECDVDFDDPNHMM